MLAIADRTHWYYVVQSRCSAERSGAHVHRESPDHKEAPPLGVAAGALIFVNPAMAAAQWLTWVTFAWTIYFDVHQDEPIQQLSQQLKALQADMSEIRALLVEHLDSPQRGA